MRSHITCGIITSTLYLLFAAHTAGLSQERELGSAERVLQRPVAESLAYPVPVLMPPNLPVSEPPALQPTPDGYYARIALPTMDIVINGTKTAYGVVANSMPQDDYVGPFEESSEELGGQIVFGRFGADYLVEFFCRDQMATTNCISEHDAIAFAQSMTLWPGVQ